MTIARRLAYLTAFATIVLIGAGVLVRATGSGLGCPDWPLCHGQAVPPTDSHHTVIEFSHRLIASGVGLLVIGLAVAAWRSYRTALLLTGIAVAVVPLVGIQGLIGALTVVRELPPEIVATHLVTAMLVLGLILAVALMMEAEDPASSRRFTRLRQRVSPQTGVLALVALAWLATLMWIGAYTAESGASAACEGWPLCNGSVLPANNEQEVVHMLHRVLAAGLAIPLIGLGAAVWRGRQGSRFLAGWVVALGALYGTQVMLGALNVWLTFPDSVTIAHTMVATLIWFLVSGAAVVSYYEPVHATQRRPVAAEAPA